MLVLYANLLGLLAASVLTRTAEVGGDMHVLAAENATSAGNAELLEIDRAYATMSQNLRQRLRARLLPIVSELLYDPKLSTKCAGALLKTGTALRTNEMWVLQMLDAIGRPPAGMMSGRLGDYGAYDQCLAMRHPQMEFQGKYCLLQFNTPKATPRIHELASKYLDHFNMKFVGNITGALESDVLKALPVFILGSCVPSSCRKEDLQFILDTVVSKYKVNLEVGWCKTQEPEPMERRQIVIIGIYATWGLLLLVGSAYDFFQRWKTRDEHANPTAPRDQGVVSRVVLAFSLRRGVLKLFQMPGWGEHGHELGFVHGMRVISATWVVLGHSNVIKDAHNFDWQTFLSRVRNDVFFTLQINAFMTVGSFFAITGFLTGYLVVKAPVVKFNRILLVAIALFRRYIRLVPAMMAVFGFMYLIPLVASGPMMGIYWPYFDRSCRNHWWRILTMTHNYMQDEKDLCMAHYWYISADYQLAIVSTIILAICIPRWPKVGLGMMTAALVATSVTTGVLTYVNNYVPYPLIITSDFRRLATTLLHVYTKAYINAPSLFTGLIFGCLAAKASSLSRKVQTLLWTVSVVFATSSLFGVYTWNSGRQPERLEAAVYAGLHRFAWAFAVSWVMYACVTGRGGLVNKILAFPLFYPLGRLSFAVYLVHIMVLVCNVLLSRERQSQQPFLMVQNNISTVLMSYAFAAIVYLCVECPIAVLDNLMFAGMKAEYDANTAAAKHQDMVQELNTVHATKGALNNCAPRQSVYATEYSHRKNSFDDSTEKQDSGPHFERYQNELNASQNRTHQGDWDEKYVSNSTVTARL